MIIVTPNPQQSLQLLPVPLHPVQHHLPTHLIQHPAPIVVVWEILMISVISVLKETIMDFLGSGRLKKEMSIVLNAKLKPVSLGTAVTKAIGVDVQTQTRMVWTLKDLNKRTVVRVGLSS